MIIFSKPSDEYGFLCPDSREGFVYNGWHFDTIQKFLAYSKAKTFGDLRAAYEILKIGRASCRERVYVLV